MPLPQCLVQRDAGGSGKVQAALAGCLRNAQTSLRVGFQQRFGQSGCLAAKHQAITIHEVCLPIGLARFAGEKPAARSIDCREKCSVIVVDGQLQSVPVIHRAAFEISIRQDKTKRADQMQAGSAGHAEPGDVTGVWGNLRLHQRDAERVRRQIRGYRFHSRTSSPKCVV